jgi:hypothetical protein
MRIVFRILTVMCGLSLFAANVNGNFPPGVFVFMLIFAYFGWRSKKDQPNKLGHSAELDNSESQMSSQLVEVKNNIEPRKTNSPSIKKILIIIGVIAAFFLIKGVIWLMIFYGVTT